MFVCALWCRTIIIVFFASETPLAALHLRDLHSPHIKQLEEMGDTSLWTALINTFFVFECYHFVTHALILFRVRLLPRKDLVRNRYYFLIDTASVFTVNIVLLQRLHLIAVCQIIQHLYYYITWDKSLLAKKVSPLTRTSIITELVCNLMMKFSSTAE